MGMTSLQNYQSVKLGKSALENHSFMPFFSEPIVASLFNQRQMDHLKVEGLTRFESLAYQSAQRAIQDSKIPIRKEKALFVLSTTKGNVELMDEDCDTQRILPAESAGRIADLLGIEKEPFVVCNACSSGIYAMLLAKSLLEAGDDEFAIVCGADVQSLFTIAGFYALCAISSMPCKPFDIERTGLNLGEAAATVVLMKENGADDGLKNNKWYLVNGCVRNDAFHLSSSSQSAIGASLALEGIKADIGSNQPAFINAHGTATLFNDQMEAVAIKNAGLTDVPVNGLKANFGHTMGAAGILETILSMMAVDDQLVLPTKGFHECGVSVPLKLNNCSKFTNKSAFVKMISGFGGVNATLLMSKSTNIQHEEMLQCQLKPLHHVVIKPNQAVLDGSPIAVYSDSENIITHLYKTRLNNYAKFYKMDKLARLGFLAAQLVIENEQIISETQHDKRAVMLFNHSSSIDADRCFFKSIQDKNHFFPSPSAFIYTLPNVVTGEIAIKNHYHGETGFLILNRKNMKLMESIVKAEMANNMMTTVIYGWVDYMNENDFEADLILADII